MRIVKYQADERVDIPDITAMSALVLGEFRRTIRALLVGADAYVVRGFAVEAESPASARVVVKLQPVGESKGAAVGAENLAGLGVDFGQLIGDRDSNFVDEGQAQQILDFTGQPNGDYVVEMRFTYADGVSDNRAFINPATLVEYVQNVPTRKVSGWQVRLTPGTASSGGEWLPLAVIAWAGATIVAGNIVDLRKLLFEGSSPYTRSSQAGAGAVDDFPRGANRADDAVGRFTFHDVIAALMRQVQDLKGASKDGAWDWFSRPYPPFDPDESLDAQQTKNLRSIDTITYTIGDGVTHVGDFNGVTGLDQCLTHIASISDANRPERVEIVVHGSSLGAYTITGQKSILPRTGDGLTLVLRGATKHTNAGTDSSQRPTVQINGASLGASEAGLTLLGGNLHVRDINFTWAGTTAGGRSMLVTGGWLIAERCDVDFGATPAVDSGFALSAADARRSRVSQCDIRGRVCFFNTNTSISPPSELLRGVIEHSRLRETQIVLHGTDGVFPDVVSGFTIRDCYISGRSVAIYTGSVGLIDGRSAQRLSIERCSFEYGINENCIDGRTYNGVRPFSWRIVDCSFISDATNGAAHAVSGGSGGADGTGWAINVQGTSAASAVRDVIVRGCRFGLLSMVDAGGVRLHFGRSSKVSGADFEFCGHDTALGTESFTAVLLSSMTECLIESMTAHRWLAGSAARTCAIRLSTVAKAVINDCVLDGNDSTGGDVTGRATSANAIDILGTVSDVVIANSIFQQWEPNGAGAGHCIMNRGAAVERFTCNNNQFRDNGGSCVRFPDGFGVNDFSVCANVVTVTRANGQGFYFAPNGTVMNGAINGNTIECTTALSAGINLGNNGKVVVSGNRLHNAVISTSGAIAWGYLGGGGPTDHNYIT